jgi:drug/metabolite transporter (DMT)-like permease
MSLWLIYALTSVFVLAGAEISQKVSLTSTDDISSETNNFVVWLLQAFISFIIFLLFSNHDTSFPLAMLPKLLLLGVIYFWGGTLYYGSFKGSSAGMSSILATISVVVSNILGIIFFHESTNFLKFIGIFLILASIVIVKFSRQLHFDKYNWLAISGGLLYGLAFNIDKSFAITINPQFYLPIFCLTTGLTTLVFRCQIVFKELKQISRRTYQTMFLSAIFGVGFNTFTLLSYANRGEVGRIDAINNFAIILVIILEMLILKNRQNVLQKILAAIVGFAGLFLLSQRI